MPAYLISTVTPCNEEAFSKYKDIAASSIQKYGGKYVVRGGDIEVLEGQMKYQAIVIVEFPEIENARQWYQSPEYAKALDIRDEALTRDLILAEGIMSGLKL